MEVKKRVSYEDIFKAKVGRLQYMNLSEIEKYRQELIAWLESISVMTKEDGIKPGRKQYLIGLRNHVVIKLIGETKKAKKKLNIKICNGSKSDVMRRFMRRSAEVLPIETFQQIYGYAIDEQSDIDD